MVDPGAAAAMAAAKLLWVASPIPCPTSRSADLAGLQAAACPAAQAAASARTCRRGTPGVCAACGSQARSGCPRIDGACRAGASEVEQSRSTTWRQCADEAHVVRGNWSDAGPPHGRSWPPRPRCSAGGRRLACIISELTYESLLCSRAGDEGSGELPTNFAQCFRIPPNGPPGRAITCRMPSGQSIKSPQVYLTGDCRQR